MNASKIYFKFCRIKYNPLHLKNLLPGLVAVLVLISTGCGMLWIVPVTVKEIKDYVNEQEQSYSYPVRQVIVSAGYSLKQLNFSLKKVEFPGESGLIKADTAGTRVSMRFDAITPNLTRLRSKIVTEKGVRYFSSEKELFNRIQEALSENTRPSLQKLAEGMTPVYAESDIESRVVAYVSPGEEVSINEKYQKPDWNEVKLEAGGSGYLPSKYLAMAAKKNETGKTVRVE